MVWLFLIGLIVFWISMAITWSRLGFMDGDREILKKDSDKNVTDKKH